MPVLSQLTHLSRTKRKNIHMCSYSPSKNEYLFQIWVHNQNDVRWFIFEKFNCVKWKSETQKGASRMCILFDMINSIILDTKGHFFHMKTNEKTINFSDKNRVPFWYFRLNFKCLYFEISFPTNIILNVSQTFRIIVSERLKIAFASVF